MKKVEIIKYECESCGTQHFFESLIDKCAKCFNDVCYSCGIYADLDNDGKWDADICDKCAEIE